MALTVIDPFLRFALLLPEEQLWLDKVWPLILIDGDRMDYNRNLNESRIFDIDDCHYVITIMKKMGIKYEIISLDSRYLKFRLSND